MSIPDIFSGSRLRLRLSIDAIWSVLCMCKLQFANAVCRAVPNELLVPGKWQGCSSAAVRTAVDFCIARFSPSQSTRHRASTPAELISAREHAYEQHMDYAQPCAAHVHFCGTLSRLIGNVVLIDA